MSAPTPILQTINEDKYEVIRKVVIPVGGDADVTAALLVDISTFTVGTTGTTCRLLEVWWSIGSNVTATLAWDASTDVPAVVLQGVGHLDFSGIGGIPNDAGTGVTGDIMFSTSGLAVAEDAGFIIVRVKKIV